ncbi:MAG: ribokinase [Firmicutes bacterium]|nr:ribokinase [Alicyclobacillaceae bacterium]MCL6497722.1 ribokinase [Bacillota bacterium]
MAVVVLGSINVDVIADVDRFPSPGETRPATQLAWMPGGKGANQALAARRMGARVVLVGSVGADALAPQALTHLEREGVDLTYVVETRRWGTGLALIAVDRTGENTIILYAGANQATGEHALASLDHVLRPRDILLVQSEIALAVVAEAVLLAQRRGAITIWDPAPALPDPPPVLLRADVVVPNQKEAEVLTGLAIHDLKAAKHAARRLVENGAGMAVVKLGKEGLVWAEAGGVFYLPAEPVEAVDTVGAGDMFAGALAALRAEGMEWHEAIRWANRAAGLSTTRRGAQPSFPRREEVLT